MNFIKEVNSSQVENNLLMEYWGFGM